MDVSGTVIARCPACGAKNRVPISRWGDTGTVCGRCKAGFARLRSFPTDRSAYRTASSPGGPRFRGVGARRVLLAPLRPLHKARASDRRARRAVRRPRQVRPHRHRAQAAGGAQQRVEGTPTILFYKRGRLVDRVVGALPKEELARRLDNAAAPRPAPFCLQAHVGKRVGDGVYRPDEAVWPLEAAYRRAQPFKGEIE